MASRDSNEVVVLDYGAGNVQSVCNAIESLGFPVRYVRSPEDIATANRLIFPGVGAFGTCVSLLKERGWFEPLRKYLSEDRPFFGICLGMQTLFEGSEESPGIEGLGVLPGQVVRFPAGGLAVPNIGWNGVAPMLEETWPLERRQPRCYFVHSYYVPLPSGGMAPWALACTMYGIQYICAVRRGNAVATQFHPEKSGVVGLEILRRWLEVAPPSPQAALTPIASLILPDAPAKRVIACLDVRMNDQGDLVVTKGDQYDVRDRDTGDNAVRNHGKPVELAARYYQEGADEVSFLNITAFREVLLDDQPMLSMLAAAAACVYVPLTVGGGIRAYTDSAGRKYSAVEVADAYFRAGADKISIGTDSVQATRDFYARGNVGDGETSIEQISKKYGRQAVVISIDPRRIYAAGPVDGHTCAEIVDGSSTPLGPDGERFVWYCCTAKGGRENTEFDVVQLAHAVEALGAGELLLNCIDRDGQGTGYELELIRMVKAACSLPVIASSGAGQPAHFETALRSASDGGGGADAALAAGIFHRREVPLEAVKVHLDQIAKIPVRR